MWNHIKEALSIGCAQTSISAKQRVWTIVWYWHISILRLHHQRTSRLIVKPWLEISTLYPRSFFPNFLFLFVIILVFASTDSPLLFPCSRYHVWYAHTSCTVCPFPVIRSERFFLFWSLKIILNCWTLTTLSPWYSINNKYFQCNHLKVLSL